MITQLGANGRIRKIKNDGKLGSYINQKIRQFVWNLKENKNNGSFISNGSDLNETLLKADKDEKITLITKKVIVITIVGSEQMSKKNEFNKLIE